MANYLYVQATPHSREGFNRQVLHFDRDERHPNGEVLIYRKEGAVFEVGDTPDIRRMIDSGTLKRVSAPATQQTQTQTATQTATQDAPTDDTAGDDADVTIPAREQLSGMSMDDLRELAGQVGVENPAQYSGAARKDDLVAAIEAQRPAGEVAG